MATTYREAEATIAADNGRTLKLVVVADTHSRPHPKLHEHVRAQVPDAILHAGDIGDLAVLDDLEAIAPTYAVRGNIDGRGARVPDDVVLTIEGGGRQMRLLLTHIAVRGPRIRADVRRRAQAREVSLVVCGHSHVPFLGTDGGLAVFNPGSCGPRRFQLPILFGSLELDSEGLRLAHFDCETGERWQPPG